MNKGILGKLLPLIGSVLAFVLLMITLSVTRPAAAEPTCGERQHVLERLAVSHAESPISMGLMKDGSVLEILKSEDGSWSILVTNPTGETCVTTMGRHWELAIPVKSGIGV